jgi:hypothetical protein
MWGGGLSNHQQQLLEKIAKNTDMLVVQGKLIIDLDEKILAALTQPVKPAVSLKFSFGTAVNK